MKAKVNQDMCIGCGACAAKCEEFSINDDGFAYAVNDEVKDENKEVVLEAKDGCPTGAIEVSEE